MIKNEAIHADNDSLDKLKMKFLKTAMTNTASTLSLLLLYVPARTLGAPLY